MIIYISFRRDLYKSYQHNSVQDYCMAPHPIRRYVFNTIQIYLAIGHFPIRLYNRYIYIYIYSFTLYYVCIVLYLCIYNFTHIPHIRQPPKPEIEFTYHQFFHKLLYIYMYIIYAVHWSSAFRDMRSARLLNSFPQKQVKVRGCDRLGYGCG